MEYKIGDRVKLKKLRYTDCLGRDRAMYRSGETVTISHILPSDNCFYVEEDLPYRHIYKIEDISHIVEDISDDDVCDWCKDNLYDGEVNTAPYNLCEGARCTEAKEAMIEDQCEDQCDNQPPTNTISKIDDLRRKVNGRPRRSRKPLEKTNVPLDIPIHLKGGEEFAQNPDSVFIFGIDDEDIELNEFKIEDVY